MSDYEEEEVVYSSELLEGNVQLARRVAAAGISCLLLLLLMAALLHATASALLHRRRCGQPPAPTLHGSLLAVTATSCAACAAYVPQFVAAIAGRWPLGGVACVLLSPLDTVLPLVLHVLQALLVLRLYRREPLPAAAVPVTTALTAVAALCLAGVVGWYAWEELVPYGTCGFSSLTEWVHQAVEPAMLVALIGLLATALWRRRYWYGWAEDEAASVTRVALRQAGLHIIIHSAASIIFVTMYVLRLRSVLMPVLVWYGPKAVCPLLTALLVLVGHSGLRGRLLTLHVPTQHRAQTPAARFHRSLRLERQIPNPPRPLCETRVVSGCPCPTWV